MSRRSPAQYFIVPRRTPDWSSLSERFQRDGTCEPSAFIPEILPTGFPGDLRARVDLWNNTFNLDFFSCRARLAEIAKESWAAVDGATLLPSNVALHQEAIAAVDARKRFLFVDDDDWFAPGLPALLEREITAGAAIVRWAAPSFNGEWTVRIQPAIGARLLVKLYRYANSRPVLEAVYRRLVGLLPQDPACPLVPADHVLYTNNYAVTERYLRYFNDFACVMDHTDATRLAIISRLRVQSRPRLYLSVTNKHPCSAGVIARVGKLDGGEARLRQRVADYVRRGRDRPIPERLAWSKRYVEQTLDIFASIL
ncbi:MAG: hypothetical protein LJE69_09360 [Thiohalocapsa sp.]|jgi:hypothetical protein|uniref:hypothetical protein n=1 Tax=Thiohalocapsa sp. TaxID=2497641 RepID=UPI0025FE6B22|nr:hypothetical protein [Thiohalocapsa sp.]MCG6941445.1 hypothetical protein [Thiohalocapsa sp.]